MIGQVLTCPFYFLAGDILMDITWRETATKHSDDDALAQRVATSRLLGQNKQLVLSGGGNTSVKVIEKDFFGEEQAILYVKGSGWDLATIETEGFAPVKMSALLKLAQMETLSDSDMMKQ